MGDKAYFDEARFGYSRFGVYTVIFDDSKSRLKQMQKPDFDQVLTNLKQVNL